MAKVISRRTLLRGAGVAMALPWLETMSKPRRSRGRSHCPNRPCAWRSCTLRTESARMLEPGRRWRTVRDHHATPEAFGGVQRRFLLLENLWHPLAQGAVPIGQDSRVAQRLPR